MTNLTKRLEQLERFFGREPECPVCQDRPASVVLTDSVDTGEPELTTDTRCPHCGSPHSTMQVRVRYVDEWPTHEARQENKEAAMTDLLQDCSSLVSATSHEDTRPA
jgi:hypothetical protein